MKIALIDYGEGGRILAEDLRARGEAVTAHDLNWIGTRPPRRCASKRSATASHSPRRTPPRCAARSSSWRRRPSCGAA
jgi:hypothetical protein